MSADIDDNATTLFSVFFIWDVLSTSILFSNKLFLHPIVDKDKLKIKNKYLNLFNLS